jgi:hypothetical protein
MEARCCRASRCRALVHTVKVVKFAAFLALRFNVPWMLTYSGRRKNEVKVNEAEE